MKLECFIIFCLFKIIKCTFDKPHNYSTNNYLKTAPLLQRVVVSAFDQLNHDHNSTVLDTFFKTKTETVQTRLNRVDRCYRSNVKNGIEMKLFEDPLSVLVHKYLQAFYPLLENALNSKNPSELLEKIVHNLVNSIKSVSRHVIQCLISLDDPNFEPSKLTFNHFSLKSSKELQTFSNLIHPTTHENLNKLQSIKKKQPLKLAQLTKIENGTGNKYIHKRIDMMKVDDVDDIPTSFDYRNQSVIGEVKKQVGETCFVFATIAAIEASYMLLMRGTGKLKPGELVHFSEMDTVNCLIKMGIKTKDEIFLKGGSPSDILSELYKKDVPMSVGGVKLEKNAPFFTDPPQPDSSLCDHSNHSQDVAIVINENYLRPVENIDILKKVLYKYGPVTVFFGTNSNERIYSLAGEQNFPCAPNVREPANQNHFMLLVGWTPKYLIIKNSWGVDWGIEGYLYLHNDHVRNCGIIGEDSIINFPVVREFNGNYTDDNDDHNNNWDWDND